MGLSLIFQLQRLRVLRASRFHLPVPEQIWQRLTPSNMKQSEHGGPAIMVPSNRCPIAKIDPATYLSSMPDAPLMDLFLRAITYLRVLGDQAAP